MLTVLDGHSRAEWPVALIDLLTGWAIRVIVTFFAARCAYVFGTFKMRRRLVCSITTRSFQRVGDWSCRMPCIRVVVSDIVPRRGHVPGNVRTLRR